MLKKLYEKSEIWFAVTWIIAFTLDTCGRISTQMQKNAAQKVGGFLRNSV